MKVETKRKDIVRFSEIEPGVCFLLGGEALIKTNEKTQVQKDPVTGLIKSEPIKEGADGVDYIEELIGTAVRISDGTVTGLLEESYVIPLVNAKIVF